ncbi:hypothetical protein BDQ17DRAFT_816291 [Cyathus striatus]|nr:hypothetical protein BDQ17DRAFT_816291 [Cyathus striatus]
MLPETSQIILFNALSIMATILTTLVLGTVICAKLKRSNAWFSLLIACLTYSLSLLLIIGRQTGPEPPFGLCFLQAALIYAGPAFIVYSFACLSIEVKPMMNRNNVPNFNFRYISISRCQYQARRVRK